MQQNIKEKDIQEKNINELKEEMNEKSFFHLFRIDINDFWNIFIEPSFIPTYFYDNCKITNIKDIDKVLKENDLLEISYLDNVKIKVLINNLIDTPNYKSFTYNIIDYPKNLYPFTVVFSFYFCSYSNSTGLLIKVRAKNFNKKNAIIDYVFKNEQIIFQNIKKYVEINFKKMDEMSSITIKKLPDEIFDFLTKNNYSNLKILLGNDASLKPTQNPDEIEIEHFTKKNKIKFKINKNIDTYEKEIILKPLESEVQIPRQLIVIKIISMKKETSLVILTHKIKQYLAIDIIKNYSILKQSLLYLLKTTIEDDNKVKK